MCLSYGVTFRCCEKKTLYCNTRYEDVTNFFAYVIAVKLTLSGSMGVMERMLLRVHYVETVR